MRKVTVQVWAPHVPGKPAHFEPREGLFHRWGEELYEQGDAPSVSYTVGIIELEDGSVITSMPIRIKFNDSPED